MAQGSQPGGSEPGKGDTAAVGWPGTSAVWEGGRAGGHALEPGNPGLVKERMGRLTFS